MINGAFYSIIEGVADNSSPLCVHFPLFSSESAIFAYSHNNQIANVPQCNPSGLYPTAAPGQDSLPTPSPHLEYGHPLDNQIERILEDMLALLAHLGREETARIAYAWDWASSGQGTHRCAEAVDTTVPYRTADLAMKIAHAFSNLYNPLCQNI
jgi:hypothetical protein